MSERADKNTALPKNVLLPIRLSRLGKKNNMSIVANDASA